MTEPAVASSDATNIQASIRREGDQYVLDGRKWWTSGAGDPRCKVLIFMGKTDPSNPDRHRQQSMILVPMDAPGVKVERMLPVFGYDDAPHGHAEITFTDVRVPADNLILGEGRGFEIAQGRLGPGRIHHCMRLIGLAERALEPCLRAAPLPRRLRQAHRRAVGVARARRRRPRGHRPDPPAGAPRRARHGRRGNKGARAEIAMIKIAAPKMACDVIDMAMQAHGAAGLCDDHGLAYAYAIARMLRVADGPDEVHRDQLDPRPWSRRAVATATASPTSPTPTSTATAWPTRADPDNDNDGVPDAMDGTPLGTEGGGAPGDADGDGLPDSEDGTPRGEDLPPVDDDAGAPEDGGGEDGGEEDGGAGDGGAEDGGVPLDK
jgi:hypothetical protein